ncbi:hypothetical protein GCM10011378_01040 [Hymenobacter glacieicola]|uniref:Uncharacterized protein n=1 Tax=Hymenobacter glacieicola TaxID=1562124 RepID=A0ABQ1WFT9_9BACT|nr:hypothetical protein GCM10011378_01040 [Hymenobacter glacieicola]
MAYAPFYFGFAGGVVFALLQPAPESFPGAGNGIGVVGEAAEMLGAHPGVGGLDSGPVAEKPRFQFLHGQLG